MHSLLKVSLIAGITFGQWSPFLRRPSVAPTRHTRQRTGSLSRRTTSPLGRRTTRTLKSSRPLVAPVVPEEKETLFASCQLEDPSGTFGVSGSVFMSQTEGDKIQIMADVSGLNEGSHGFHVHHFGDISGGCGSTGGHYNPDMTNHGAFNDPRQSRHTGDLKSLVADQSGVASYSNDDSLASLFGDNSVIGRALVVHAGADDLGRGGDAGSIASGNAGSRVACCVIGRAKDMPAPQNKPKPVDIAPETERIPGGFGGLEPMTPEVHLMLAKLKDDVQSMVGTTFKHFNPLGYRTQVVAGLNYIFQVATEQGTLEVKIFKPLPFRHEDPSVTSAKWI